VNSRLTKAFIQTRIDDLMRNADRSRILEELPSQRDMSPRRIQSVRSRFGLRSLRARAA
jgi:hypothetical protein